MLKFHYAFLDWYHSLDDVFSVIYDNVSPYLVIILIAGILLISAFFVCSFVWTGLAVLFDSLMEKLKGGAA